MKLIKAHKLKVGDSVGIISPSEPIIYKNEFFTGVKELEKLGLKVILGKNIFKSRGGYMAGTIKERLNDFHSMIKNPKVKAIFTSVGGFCVNQMLPLINYSLVKKNPKIILGYSDITALTNAIYAKTGLITFHGPNVEFIIAGWSSFTKKSFMRAIFQTRPIGRVSGISTWKVLKNGKASGSLIGGNLTVLRTLIGTNYSPNWKSAILFWEDRDLTYEDLDHFLTHFKMAGILDKISGMIIGKNKNFTEVGEGPKSKNKVLLSPNEIILERTEEYRFPIISEVQFGHIGEQITIPIGVKATIDTSKRLFSIDENGVI